jgi:hypothetical protein
MGTMSIPGGRPGARAACTRGSSAARLRCRTRHGPGLGRARDALLAPAADAGDVEFGQSGHLVSVQDPRPRGDLPGGSLPARRGVPRPQRRLDRPALGVIAPQLAVATRGRKTCRRGVVTTAQSPPSGLITHLDPALTSTEVSGGRRVPALVMSHGLTFTAMGHPPGIAGQVLTHSGSPPAMTSMPCVPPQCAPSRPLTDKAPAGPSITATRSRTSAQDPLRQCGRRGGQAADRSDRRPRRTAAPQRRHTENPPHHSTSISRSR